jgi:hypothetical protein
MNIKYDRLDNESDDGSDVPLLLLDNQNNQTNQHNQINQHNQDNISSDSDSVILNLNQQPNLNQQNYINKFDNISRNIIRFFIINIILVSITFSILIIGAVDYYHTKPENIIYGSYGDTLFLYYYIINICWYLTFLLISVYLILYIICCSKISNPVREIPFFKFLKLNMIVFTLNIIIKVSYAIFIMLLTNYKNNVVIDHIPVYYNYIQVEIIAYMVMQIFNNMFLGIINDIINMK